MKITILTNSFQPDPIGIAPLSSELAEDLAQQGHEVTVATAFPHYPDWVIPPAYQGKVYSREQWRGVNVLRSWLKVSKRATAMSKMIAYATFTASATLGSLVWDKPDLLFVISPPLSLSFTAFLTKAFLRCPTVLLICDLLPDTAIALGMIKNPHFIKALFAFEKWSYPRFDHIAVVSNAFRKNLIKKGVPAEKVSVIYTWVDTDFIRPLRRENEFRFRNQLQDKFIVLYAGNIGLSQGLETALEAARLLEDYPQIEFLIVGDGTKGAELKQRAEAMRLPNFRFLPLQPRSDIPLMYSAADVSLVLQRKNVLDINLPGKIQTIMSSGRPMIAGTRSDGEVAQIVEASGAGILIVPEDSQQLANAVLQLYRDSALCEKLGANGREYALHHFAKKSAVNSYLGIFANLWSQAELGNRANSDLAATSLTEQKDV